MISEFGFPTPFEAQKTALADILYDQERVTYFADYMSGVLIAISEGVNVMVRWPGVSSTIWNGHWASKSSSVYSM